NDLTSGTYSVTARNTSDPTCVSTALSVTINDVPNAPDAPVSSGDISQCSEDPIQVLDANTVISVGPNESVVWYDQEIGGNVVNPIWSAIGSKTFWAEAVNDFDNTCISTNRTPVVLTINDCGINIEKIASPNNSQGCTPLAIGESISYTFKVTNNGTTPISNVVVTDVMIATISGPTGDTNNDGKLDVSEIWEFTGSYVVTAQDIINGQVINTAEVTGEAEASTPFPVSGSDTETVNLCQNAEMSIVKSTSSATTDCINFIIGDTIDYEFVVTNEGDVDIEDVVITDPLFESPNPIVTINLVSGDLNNDGILNVGEVWTFEATYTIDQDNIDAGSIVNTATVNGNSALGPVDTATSNTVTVLICTDASIALIKTSDVEVDPTTGCSTLEVGDV
ncbi:DUF7507 domain-containing protein, partial [Aequorivita sediminis]|uniref:DUF7507 domain-containing protein n=1 Tax=Aequorivita sediminis TaxID=3073653 RepID=UPI0028AACA18